METDMYLWSAGEAGKAECESSAAAKERSLSLHPDPQTKPKDEKEPSEHLREKQAMS